MTAKELLLNYLSNLINRMKEDLKMEDAPIKCGKNRYNSIDELNEAWGFGGISKKAYERISDEFYNRNEKRKELSKAIDLAVELYRLAEEKIQ